MTRERLNMVDWEFFRRKRRIDVAMWMERCGITSYKKFCQVLASLGVRAPERSVYNKHLPKVKPKKSILSKPMPDEKTSRRSKTRKSKSVKPSDKKPKESKKADTDD